MQPSVPSPETSPEQGQGCLVLPQEQHGSGEGAKPGVWTATAVPWATHNLFLPPRATETSLDAAPAVTRPSSLPELCL